MQHKEIGQSEALSQACTTSKNCPFAALKREPCWRVRVCTASTYFLYLRCFIVIALSHMYTHTHTHIRTCTNTCTYAQTQRRHGYRHEIIQLLHLANSVSSIADLRKKKEEQMFCACELIVHSQRHTLSRCTRTANSCLLYGSDIMYN